MYCHYNYTHIIIIYKYLVAFNTSGLQYIIAIVIAIIIFCITLYFMFISYWRKKGMLWSEIVHNS